MSMKEWGAAWQRAMLAKPKTKERERGRGYAWAENAVAALFLAGWMAAILIGRL